MEKYLKKLIKIIEEDRDAESKLKKEAEESLSLDVDMIYETISNILDNPNNEGTITITLSDAEGNCRAFIDVQDGLSHILESIRRVFIRQIQFGYEYRMTECLKYRIGKLENKFKQMVGSDSFGIRYVNGSDCKGLDDMSAPKGINDKHSYLELRFKVDVNAIQH